MDAQTNITIGLDVGDRYTNVAMVDEAGELIEESRIRTTPAAVRRRFEAEAPARVALEAGTHSPWMSRLLERAGHDVVVANARRLRFIYDSDNKRDPTDAEALARVARLDPKLLKPIRHRSETAQRSPYYASSLGRAHPPARSRCSAVTVSPPAAPPGRRSRSR